MLPLPLLFTTLTSTSHALSLNAFTPNVYWPGQKLPLAVNKVYSKHTELPFAYYDLPFVCAPKDGLSKAALTLGEILRGDRTLNSDIDIEMLRTEPCRFLCSKTLDAEDIKQAHRLIKQDYKVEWYLDELPGATAIITHDKAQKYYTSGFPLGSIGMDGKTTFLHNHFNIVIKYRHSDNHDATRVILAFEVYPRSIDSQPYQINRQIDTCGIPELDNPNAPLAISLQDAEHNMKKTLSISYTYSVYFREDLDLHWVNRWNLYFSYTEARVVWYTTLVSAGVCLLMSAVVAVILLRTLRREMTHAAMPLKTDLEFDSEESAGWKLIRAEVFRPPSRSNLLSALIGSGVQLTVSSIILVLLSSTGLAHNRGRLSSVAVFLFAFAGEFSGYFSSRIYKSLGHEDWLHNGLWTALILPAVSFALMLIIDMFAWIQGSTVALPFGTIVELIAAWGGISLPLVFVGSYVGHRSPKVIYPGRVNAVPRQIPKQPIYTRFWPSIIISGMLPYAVICTESYFILKSFELHQDGYLFFIFGSLSIVLLISIVTTIEVTVTMVFLQLQNENYNWWWPAFLYGCSGSAYLFVHAALYFMYHLRYGFISGIIYFGYTLLFCFIYGVFQGTLGFLVSSAFVRKIYGAIKAD